MNFEDDEEWDLDLIDDLVRKEEEAIAAKRASQVAQSRQSSTLVPSASSFSPLQPLLRVGHAPSFSSNGAAKEPLRRSQVPQVQKAPVSFTAGTDDGNLTPNWNIADHHEHLSMGRSTVGDTNVAQPPKYITPPISGSHGIQYRPLGHNLASHAHHNSGNRYDHDASMGGLTQNTLDASKNKRTFQNYSAGRSVLSEEAKAIWQMVDEYSKTAQPKGIEILEGSLVHKEILMGDLPRSFQADQELSQCLGKLPLQTSTVATSFEQKEIQRLTTQVLFKEQEVLEARRLCSEKSEQLKRVIGEVDSLRKECEELKQLRQSEALVEGKHTKERKSENLQGTVNTSPPSSANRDQHITDAWLPPWKLEGVQEVLQDVPKVRSSIALGEAQSKTAALDKEDVVITAELKARTFDNGCTSTGQIESIPNNSSVQEGPQMPSISPRDAQNMGRKLKLSAIAETIEKRIIYQPSDCSPKLLKIWGSRSKKEDCLELISKLFAVCQSDMQVLLSIGLDEVGCIKKSTKMKPAEALAVRNTINQTVDKGITSNFNDNHNEVDVDRLKAQMLHSILAKMANGLASSWTLFVAILDFCRHQSVQVVESGLRVLHCILVHDRNCGNYLFGRTSVKLARKRDLQFLPFSDKGEKSQIKGFDDGHTVVSRSDDQFAAADSVHLESNFSSPRVYCQMEGPAVVQCREEEVSPEQNKNITTESCNDFKSEKSERFLFDKCKHDILARQLFGRISSMALKGASQAVRAEAMSILIVLAMHTEPMIQRQHFGSILFDGSIASLLSKPAGLDVQLQAVRLVHILLHCPLLFKQLWAPEEEMLEDFTALPGEVREDICVQNGENSTKNTDESSPLAAGKQPTVQSELPFPPRDSELNRVELLEGLTSCLHNVCGTVQEYTLQRSALRVLAFIATSGHKGLSTLLALLATKVTFCKEGIRKEASGGRIKVSNNIVPRSLPVHIIFLIDKELKAEEEDGNLSVKSAEAEERECLIREGLTLLCRLASHSTYSSTTLDALTVDKATTRLSICVTNRLISRATSSEASILEEDKYAVVPADIFEFAKGLRRRILAHVANS